MGSNSNQPEDRQGRTQPRTGGSRREFLAGGAAAAIAAMSFPHILPAQARGANERPRLASIGVGGKGGSDIDHAAAHADIVAMCDVDQKSIDAKLKLYPKAKIYRDFRKLFDEMGNDIDAVTVSTPDVGPRRSDVVMACLRLCAAGEASRAAGGSGPLAGNGSGH